MIEPGKRLLHRRKRRNLWQCRPRHHDHRELKRARCGNLAVGGSPAAVFCHHHVDAMALQQGTVLGLVERPARGDVDRVRHCEWRVDRIDAADEIDMLRCRGERLKLLAPKREEHAARRLPECAHCLIDCRNLNPTVAIGLRPRRAPERQQWHTRLARGFGRVGGDGRGVRVCRVDQRIDLLAAQIVRQAFSAAEAADPHRYWLGQGLSRAAGERQRHRETGAPGKSLSKQPCFDRSAEDEDAARAR